MVVWVQKLFALALLVFFFGCQTTVRKTGFLPGPGEIASIEAKVNGEFLNESSTSLFQVNETLYDLVSKCLSSNPIETVDSSGFGKPIGVLEITDRTGNAYLVEFPWSGKNVLVFTINGKWFSRNGPPQTIDRISGKELAFAADESMLLYKALRKHYDETKADESQKKN